MMREPEKFNRPFGPNDYVVNADWVKWAEARIAELEGEVKHRNAQQEVTIVRSNDGYGWIYVDGVMRFESSGWKYTLADVDDDWLSRFGGVQSMPIKLEDVKLTSTEEINTNDK